MKHPKYSLAEDRLSERMNQKNMILANAAIVAAVAFTGVPFIIPQQASAHSGHHHNYSSNSITQQTDQANICDGTSPLCDNQANNIANRLSSPNVKERVKTDDTNSIFFLTNTLKIYEQKLA